MYSFISNGQHIAPKLSFSFMTVKRTRGEGGGKEGSDDRSEFPEGD